MDTSLLQKLCKISISASPTQTCCLFFVVKPSKATGKANFDLLIDSQFSSLTLDEGIQNMVVP